MEPKRSCEISLDEAKIVKYSADDSSKDSHIFGFLIQPTKSLFI